MRRLLTVALAVVLAGGPALAKDKAPAAEKSSSSGSGSGSGAGLDFADQKSDNPLEIYADQGLELSQDAKTVIARVNAKAIRGKVTVTGDVMVAHYRNKVVVPGAPGAPPPPKPDKDTDKDKDPTGGSTEVWRLESTGHVTIATPTQTAYGDHADYNIDDAVVVLTGKDLKMVTPTDVVTARDSLEYWEHRNQAVARGAAMAIRAEKKIQADVLVADFAENSEKQMAMQRAHGYDHVVLTTPREVVTGDRADYDVESGIVTVTGSVKITREKNQLDGGYAVVNLNTGISRIFPAGPGLASSAGDQRVKGVFVPQKKQAAEQSPSSVNSTAGGAGEGAAAGDAAKAPSESAQPGSP